MIDMADKPREGSGETFFNVPKATLNDLSGVDVAILGVPCATPYASVGPYAANAPDALRHAIASDAHDTPHMDFDLAGPTLGTGQTTFADLGDIDWSETDFEANRATIADAIKRIRQADAVPVVLGGDDSIPIPMYDALADHGPFTILQIDAHIDWRDNIGGEKLGLSSNMRRASEMPHIEKIIQVGARGIGSARPSDHADAVAWGVKFITAQDLMQSGIEKALEHVPANANLLLNFDVDALDPAIMPAVIGPSPGGLSYWQGVELVRGAIAKANLACFSIVEFYPDRDPNGHAALTAARFVCNALGALARKSD